MKWNILIGSLMLGASLCTPSFGGGLLDRMLGLRGSGCDSACCDTGCAADPACGCEVNACDTGCAADPACGCEVNACDPCAGIGPNCGCETAACDGGCDSCCVRRRPLRELLHAVHCKSRALISKLHVRKACCDSGCAAAPSCGCESGCAPACGCEVKACDPCAGIGPNCGCETAGCDNGCDNGCDAVSCCKPRCGLLSKLFRKRSNCCDSMGCDACGCTSAPAAAPEADAAPMPPAPAVDPSAMLQNNRRVIQATGFVR